MLENATDLKRTTAEILVTMKRFDEGHDLFKELWETSRRVYGRTALNSLVDQQGLACALLQMGRREEAREHLRELWGNTLQLANFKAETITSTAGMVYANEILIEDGDLEEAKLVLFVVLEALEVAISLFYSFY